MKSFLTDSWSFSHTKQIEKSIFNTESHLPSYPFHVCLTTVLTSSLAWLYRDDCYVLVYYPHGDVLAAVSPARTHCKRPPWFIRAPYCNNEMLSLTACGTSCQPLLGDEAASRCRLTLPYAVSATRNTLYRKRLGDTRGMLRCKALVYRHHLRLHAISFDQDCGSGMHYWLNTIGFVHVPETARELFSNRTYGAFGLTVSPR